MKQNPILFCVLVIIAILSVASGAKASDFLSDGAAANISTVVCADGKCPLLKVASAVKDVATAPVAAVVHAARKPDVVSYGSSCGVDHRGVGWSKSWHKVHGQPVRNIVRRIFGK